MLKALIKKELSQLAAFYRYDRRNGKRRSGGAAAAYILLFVFVFLSMAAMFMGLSFMLSDQLIPQGLGWLYFAMMGLTSIVFGVFGSVFTTHTILYKAKDNETLLSMPIPPSKILFTRMLIVFAFSFLLVMLAWVPAMLRYAAMGANSGVSVLLQIILLFMLAAFVTVLNCVLGWLVALLSRRIRNKTAATVILSLVFLGAYYFFYFKIREILNYILGNVDKFESAFRGWGWPLSQLGMGAVGSVPAAGIFSAIVLALFAIAYAVLSATLIKILTASQAGKKTVYREKRMEQSGADRALLFKEFKRFTGSATYMLNSGLGVLISIAVSVFIIIKAGAVREQVTGLLANIGLENALPLLVIAVIALSGSMVIYTAPSVSLEGKNIWILQSMPVSAGKVLSSKVNMQMLLSFVPSMLLLAAAAVVFRMSILDTLAAAVFIYSIDLFSAEFGLAMNLLKPNLAWTNEAVPIKQGAPVVFTMFLGWVLAALAFGVGFALSLVMPVFAAIIILAAPLIIAALFIRRWIVRKGAEIFAHLS